MTGHCKLLPGIFPNVEWFCAYAQHQNIHLYTGKFNAEKHKPIHRISIAGPNGLLSLSIPINRSENHSYVKDIQISYDHKWVREHLNTFKASYGKSPFYEFYDYKIFPLFEKRIKYLLDFNLNSMELLAGFFELEPKTLTLFEEPLFVPPAPKPLIPYPQVFEDRWGFREPVSALDLLFNQGPMSYEYFRNAINTGHWETTKPENSL